MLHVKRNVTGAYDVYYEDRNSYCSVLAFIQGHQKNPLVENVNILFSWRYIFMGLVVKCSATHRFVALCLLMCSWLTGIHIFAECSHYTGIHSRDSPLCYMACKFQVSCYCLPHFYICIEEDLQVSVWFVVYWISENRKCVKDGVTKKTMDFRRGCWKLRVACVLNPK